jgi:deazaflavin-dependent oxidoreductase (nitroreductase family)
MHLPRDPGEWLVMAVLMGALMLALHRLRSHLTRSVPRHQGLAMRAAGFVVGVLLRLGVRVTLLGPMELLSVRGRTSGRERTLPIDVHQVNGRRYLIATHGVGGWVHNLRASGEGSLRLGPRREVFRARELSAADGGPVLRAALDDLLADGGWRGRTLRSNLGLAPGADADAWVRAAEAHPAFEITPV